MSDILQWLKEHGLGKYADLFVENEIDLDVLPHLTEADIDRLSLPTGSRRKLLVAITTLSSIDSDTTDEGSWAGEAGSRSANGS